jgi:hypothetical protein
LPEPLALAALRRPGHAKEHTMVKFIDRICGPRAPICGAGSPRCRYALPNIFFMLARVLLLASIFFPYWLMDLDAPQYPDGLYLDAYVTHLDGDVKEINGLNHYIGMRPLEQAGSYERAASIWMIIAMTLLVEGASVVHRRWAVLLALPAILFPAVFLIDLHFWMTAFGQNLDPEAPLSASIKPFTPTVLGEGGIGQFHTYAQVGRGFWMAVASAGLIIVGFVFHRRAYKPLVEAAGVPNAFAKGAV